MTFTISSFINLCLIYYSFHLSTLKICSIEVLILDFYGQYSSGKCLHVAMQFYLDVQVLKAFVITIILAEH